MRILIFTLVIISNSAFAFNFFDNHIDYWNESKIKKDSPIERTTTQKKEDKSFDWEKYKDPNSKEFFKEGNHVPPEPLMELARNPSDENIKNWFEVVEAKNKLMTRLHERLQEYLKQNSAKMKSEDRELVEQKIEEIKVKKVDIRRFRFRLYFDSTCSACKAMVTTLSELQTMGYYVELRQIDRKRPKFPVPFPVVPASEKEIKERKINSWPVLFVADTDKKLIYRINGYFPTDEVLKTLSQK